MSRRLTGDVELSLPELLTIASLLDETLATLTDTTALAESDPEDGDAA